VPLSLFPPGRAEALIAGEMKLDATSSSVAMQQPVCFREIGARVACSSRRFL
jgi:hypothetical protein